MTNLLQPVRGTKDLLAKEYLIQEYIINTAQSISKLYGYETISTPIIEYSNIFERTLGDSTDVVSKEIYRFNDRSNESIALRPEFTAGIVRAFISNGLAHLLPLRFFSFGPVFRYDRPQAGRQRQFNQLNFEFLGASHPSHDAEIIKLADDILKKLGIEATLEINSLGGYETKHIYNKKLYEYFSAYKDKLSADSLRRLEKNPLRILDSKDDGDQQLLSNAPLISEFYTEYDKKYFMQVTEYLDSLQVQYIINPFLVRGLDYYQHTCFEYLTHKIGAQSAILGGGRYDGLAEIMGGAPTPAIGFGAGIERLALMHEYSIAQVLPVVILPLNEIDLSEAIIVADELRQSAIPVVIIEKGKIDKRFNKVIKSDYQNVIFIGEEERKSKKYQFKDVPNKVQQFLPLLELVALLKSKY